MSTHVKWCNMPTHATYETNLQRLQAENAALRKIIEQQKKDGMSREAKRLIVAEVGRTEKERQRAEAAKARLEALPDPVELVIAQKRIEQLEAGLRELRNCHCDSEGVCSECEALADALLA